MVISGAETGMIGTGFLRLREAQFKACILASTRYWASTFKVACTNPDLQGPRALGVGLGKVVLPTVTNDTLLPVRPSNRSGGAYIARRIPHKLLHVAAVICTIEALSTCSSPLRIQRLVPLEGGTLEVVLQHGG